MDISNGQKALATRADLKRLGIIVSNSTLLRWEARGRFPRRVRLAGTSRLYSRSLTVMFIGYSALGDVIWYPLAK